jgi:hypothetical protein
VRKETQRGKYEEESTSRGVHLGQKGAHCRVGLELQHDIRGVVIRRAVRDIVPLAPRGHHAAHEAAHGGPGPPHCREN